MTRQKRRLQKLWISSVLRNDQKDYNATNTTSMQLEGAWPNQATADYFADIFFKSSSVCHMPSSQHVQVISFYLNKTMSFTRNLII
mmetsp:Transcript_48373/g.48715  ORF Transcript_48373/g.48715 Transcript_48373/m.48715 type:complete len:86 (-) Transcript_48373:51-308(-)